MRHVENSQVRASNTGSVQVDLPGLLCATGGQRQAEQTTCSSHVGSDQSNDRLPGQGANPCSSESGLRPIRFTVPGAAVGKGRPKFARRGKFVTTYTPEKTVSFENLVKLYANQAMAGKHLIEQAVTVQIELWVSVPASWSKKKQHQALTGEIRPMTKPDADNVAKAICDAMNEIVYTDDKQIVDLRVRKFYDSHPRSVVTVSAVGVA